MQIGDMLGENNANPMENQILYGFLIYKLGHY